MSKWAFLIAKFDQFCLGVRKGDKGYILSGGKTPFILRSCGPPRGDMTGRIFHTVIAEAFVNGLMYSQGSLQTDSEEGKVGPEWYHLR